ncbi:MAG: TlpA family protein disulfide reductase [Thermoleophilaceae bacterium]|nr:TlpA family protein disulfide reductase [Thermoleophilaceae bacterium]
MRRTTSPTAIAALALIVAVFALLIYGVAHSGGNKAIESAIASGKPATAPVRVGKMVGARGNTSLADYRGKVVAFNLWASWCEPCRVEAPALERAWKKYRNQGFVVLGGDVDDLTSDALAFKREFGLTYPLMRYSNTNSKHDWGSTGLPETFIVDRQGKVVAVRRFQVDDKWLNANIKPLLAK